MPRHRDRRLVLAACAAAIFWPGVFIFCLPGVLRHHWQQAFGVGGGAVGRTVFFILAGATCFMYLCGRWQERYGPARLAACGALITAASAAWLAAAGSMGAVYGWAFAVGAASAFVYVPLLTVVQRWYPERRGLVSGIFNMAFGMAAAVMSPVAAWMLIRWGYAAVNLALGAAALAVGLAAAALVGAPPAAAVADNPGAAADGSHTASQVLRSRQFWCLWLTWATAGAAGASMLVLATGFGQARGLSLTEAVVLLTAFNITNGAGRLVSGLVSDWIGRSRTMAVAFAAAAAAYLALPQVGQPWLWAVLSAVVGYAFGTLFAVSAPLAGDCFGMTHFGAIFGLVFTAYGLASGPLGPWLSGYLLDRTGGDYTLVFGYLGGLYAAAAGLILMIRPWRECRP